MDVDSAKVYTDFAGLSALRQQARANPNQAVEEVAGQFESIFVQMMLKSMRDASIDGGLFDSNQLDLYQSMFDQQISLDLSNKGAVGLAEIIVDQLSANPESAAITQGNPFIRPKGYTEQPVALIDTVSRSPIAETRQAGKTEPPESDWRPDTPENFIRDLWPHAVNAARKLGVAPEVLVAQSALETGWGQKTIRSADGSNSFNLFGIKADDRWSGDKARVTTLEYRDGIARREYADFRAYGSVAQAFDDYVSFLQGSPRYQQALTSASDGSQYLRELQGAGYATDPKYAEKIIGILERQNHREVFDGLQAEAESVTGQTAATLKDLPEMPLFERATLASSVSH